MVDGVKARVSEPRGESEAELLDFVAAQGVTASAVGGVQVIKTRG